MTHIKGSNLTKFFGLETHKSNFFSSGDWASALTQKEVQNASHGFRFWWDWWSEMTCWQLIPLRGSLQSLRTIEPTIKHHRNRKTQLGMQAHLQASSSVYVTVQRDAQKLSNTVCSILLSVFFAHPPEAWKKKKNAEQWFPFLYNLQSAWRENDCPWGHKLTGVATFLLQIVKRTSARKEEKITATPEDDLHAATINRQSLIDTAIFFILQSTQMDDTQTCRQSAVWMQNKAKTKSGGHVSSPRQSRS